MRNRERHKIETCDYCYYNRLNQLDSMKYKGDWVNYQPLDFDLYECTCHIGYTVCQDRFCLFYIRATEDMPRALVVKIV